MILCSLSVTMMEIRALSAPWREKIYSEHQNGQKYYLAKRKEQTVISIQFKLNNTATLENFLFFVNQSFVAFEEIAFISIDD